VSDKPSGSPAWMATFADLMSLLMALFVLLYAMSSIDVVKYQSIVESFNETLGNGDELTPEQESFFQSVQKSVNETPPAVVEPPSLVVDKSEAEMKALFKELSQSFSMTGDSSIMVEYDEQSNQIKLVFPEQIAFDAGRAVVKPRFIILLRRLSPLREHDLTIKVFGHTDSRPVSGGRFRNNWELSSARASAVVSQLIVDGCVLPEQTQAIGVADTQPIALGKTETDFAKNRRVEVVLSTKSGEDIETIKPQLANE
jgi:chemotaxis protein MotB